MNHKTIVDAVDKLSTNYDTFTSVELKEQRVKLLMEAFKYKLDSSLKSAVERVIHDENIKRFPIISQLENYMPVLHNQAQEYCDKCEHTGYYNVWQRQESIGKWYDFAYRCICNNTTMQNIPVIDERAIPTRAHNPHPPEDPKHNEFNLRKAPWDYKRLDNDTFKALAYSHKMKSVLKSAN